MKIRRPLLAAVLVLLPLGCTAPVLKPEIPIFYPPEPETPRIVYERSVRGTIDFKKVNLIDRLLGVTVRLEMEKPFDAYIRGDRVYVTDTGNGVVHVVDPKAETMSTIGSQGNGALKFPTGIRGTADGRIFVADGLLKLVNVYDASGAYLQTIGKKGDFVNPAGIAINESLGRLYVADSKAHAIKVFSLKGDFLFQFGRGGEGDGSFLFPSFIAVDRRNGNVVVSDTNNFRVQVFDADGKFIMRFGELGDAPGYFQRPKGIGVDSDGNIYVVEAVFNNFQIFNSKGEILTWVGQGGSHSGGLFVGPAGLYVDENDKVLVVDVINKRVQVFQYMSEKWKAANPEQFEKYRNRMKAAP